MLREFCFFGRGGQGAVTSAQILATAAFREGRYSQTFPQFGMERRGAPLQAFLRIDKEPIQIRGRIQHSDGIIILDQKMLRIANPLGSLKENGFLVINSKRSPDYFLSEFRTGKIKAYSVDASSLSAHVYGPTPIPITSVIMLGAFAAMTGEIQMGSIREVLGSFFRESQIEANTKALEMGFEQARSSS